MPSIEKRVRNGQRVWRAHYRTPDGSQRNKSFARKADAERFLATVESAKLTGTYVDPQLAKVTVGLWAERWLAGQAHLKPSTFQRYDGIISKHIEPKLGPSQARVRFARRRTDVGHNARRNPGAGQCGQDPSGAQPGSGHGGQGRALGTQRCYRRQPAARREA